MSPRAASAPARVVRDPHIQGGLPTIRGTRVTVHAVAAHCRSGLGVEAIQRSFPQLQPEDVLAAIRYYRAHQAEIDGELDAEERAAP